MLRELGVAHPPDPLGALVVAVGLTHHVAATSRLRELLQRRRNRDGLAGHLALGLSMLAPTTATHELEELLEASPRRPDRLRDTAAAVVCTADHRAVEFCVEQLGHPHAFATWAALAVALAVLDAEEAVPPLIARLADATNESLHRAFAAATLGCLVSRDRPTRSAEVAFACCSRAAVPTLTNRIDVILDLL